MPNSNYLKELFINEAKPALERHSGGSGGGGVSVPMVTISYEVANGTPINIIYMTVNNNTYERASISDTVNGTIEVVANSYIAIYTSVIRDAFGGDIYPPIDDIVSSNGLSYYIYYARGDYSDAVVCIGLEDAHLIIHPGSIGEGW